jgi:threonine/homoserine/homoserine lactone efflux protein
MIPYLLQGISYGFAAAVQPGPLQAYIVLQALRNGWRRTLVFALVPLLSDLPIISLVIFVLAAIPHAWIAALQIAGGVFLLYLAANAVRAARNLPQNAEAERESRPRGLLPAVLINLLNPNPYLFWGTVTGPILLSGWRESPVNGAGLLAGFYITMILFNAVLILTVSAAHRFNPRVRRVLMILSAIGLAVFGVYQLWTGMSGWSR